MQVVGDLAVVCTDVEAQEIVAVFVFKLYRFLVEVQRWIALKFVFVDKDGTVVHVCADPQLICKVSVAGKLSVHAKPCDLRCYYGASRQNGADLVAHGGSTGLLEYFTKGRERASVEAELDDSWNVLRLHLYHVGFNTVRGLA